MHCIAKEWIIQNRMAINHSYIPSQAEIKKQGQRLVEGKLKMM